MSERHLRQKYFPDRRKLVHSKVKPRYTRRRPENQSTLTQLNYVVPSSNEQNDSSLSDIDDAELTGTRKRRKVESKRAKEDRQSTLTQWEWFEYRYFSDGEEDEKGIKSEHKAEKLDAPMSKRSSTLQVTDSAPPGDIYIPSKMLYAKKWPKTPRKPVRTAIPSSQSPSITPLSTPATPRSISGGSVYTPPTNPSPPGPECAGESPLRGKYTGIARGGIGTSYSSTTLPIAESSVRKPPKTSKIYENDRSSQATTIDMSQPITEQFPPPAPSRRLPSSMPPESQLPLTFSSDIGSNFTLLQPIEDSADLPTVSQLLSESMQ